MSQTKNYGTTPIKKVLRTPKERFRNLPEYPFDENYILLNEQPGEGVRLRMHYLDEGDKSSKETILLLHGEPTWSYLYRKFIPILEEKRFRIIAPDLIGFGKSDKPANFEDFSYARKINWLASFVEQLDLKNVTLFCQDWGGLIGLRVVQKMPDRFARVAIGNTSLPTGHNEKFQSKYFFKWANEISQKMTSWGSLLQLSVQQGLNDDVADAYDSPFPDESFKVATRVVPKLVPVTDEHSEVEENKQALQFFSKWKKPFITLFSDKDPIFGQSIPEFWQKLVPGAKGQNHEVIRNAGHFLQEDQPEAICKAIINFIYNNSNAGLEIKSHNFPKL